MKERIKWSFSCLIYQKTKETTH